MPAPSHSNPPPPPQPTIHTSGTPPKTTTTLLLHNFLITTVKAPILKSYELDAMGAELKITPPEMIFGENEVRVEWLGPSPEAEAGETPQTVVQHVAGGGANWQEGVDAVKDKNPTREGAGRQARWGISFNAYDALDLVDKTGEGGMLRVKYSEEWQRQREQLHSTIKEYVRPFDWSYTTSYKGTVLPKSAIPPTPPPPPGSTPPPPEPPIADSRATAAPAFTSTTNPLPIPLLTLPDPILLFDNVVLYEDELADNGISLLSVKIRVMPHRLLILSRFFLRLDGVLCRIRDVRIYIDFGVPRAPGVGSIQGGGEWGTAGPGRPLVMREYTEKEGTWDEVLAGLRGVRRSEIPSVLRDAGRVVEVLGEVKRCEREMVVLG